MHKKILASSLYICFYEREFIIEFHDSMQILTRDLIAAKIV